MPDGSRRTIHLPLTPEYLGYADSGLCEGFFTASRPGIELQASIEPIPVPQPVTTKSAAREFSKMPVSKPFIT